MFNSAVVIELGNYDGPQYTSCMLDIFRTCGVVVVFTARLGRT